MVYDAKRQMLTSLILSCTLVKYIYNINDERKKEKDPSIIIYYVNIINSPKPKKSN